MPPEQQLSPWPSREADAKPRTRLGCAPMPLEAGTADRRLVDAGARFHDQQPTPGHQDEDDGAVLAGVTATRPMPQAPPPGGRLAWLFGAGATFGLAFVPGRDLDLVDFDGAGEAALTLLTE